MSSCGSKRWKCAWCGKATGCKTYPSLSSHMSQSCRQKPAHLVRQKVEEKDKRFICDCGRPFEQKKYLARHQKDFCVNKKEPKYSSNSSSETAFLSKSSSASSSTKRKEATSKSANAKSSSKERKTKKRKEATGESANAKSSSKKRKTKDTTDNSPTSNHLLSDIPTVPI